MKTIKIHNGKEARVDDEDFDFLSRFRLDTTKLDGQEILTVTFESRTKRIVIPASHLLMKPSGIQVVVYKNRDHYDLRKQNLIVASYSHFIHSFSRTYSKNYPKTSKYRGVSWQKTKNRWKASIMCNGIRKQNSFATEKLAGEAYNRWAKEFYGDLAYQNKIV